MIPDRPKSVHLQFDGLLCSIQRNVSNRTRMGEYTSADMVNKAEKCVMVIKMNNQEKTDYSGKRE